jgi:hypothetical protein
MLQMRQPKPGRRSGCRQPGARVRRLRHPRVSREQSLVTASIRCKADTAHRHRNASHDSRRGNRIVSPA